MPYRSLMPALIEEVRATGFMLREALKDPENRKVVTKSTNSFVTEMDVAAEERLVSALRKLLPEAGFITEEETVAHDGNTLAWVIDPIDGTTNFMYGIPCYSISVALMQDGIPLLGVVYEVAQDECFSAIRGEGALLNGTPIRMNRPTALKDCLIATGFPYQAEDSVDRLLAILRQLIPNSRGIRRLGSAAVDLAYTACGRFDAFYEHTLNIWDIAAGVLIVQEAGGVITDFSGGKGYFGNGQIVAAGKEVHEELLAIVRGAFEA